jgi:hypothetical protein
MQQEVAQEVSQLLEVILRGRRSSGRLDLEAVEMATRAAMHRAGAAVLSELLTSSEAAPGKVPLRLRKASPLSRQPPQTTHYRGGKSLLRPRLLPLRALPPGPQSARPRVGRGGHGVFAGRAPHAGGSGQRVEF